MNRRDFLMNSTTAATMVLLPRAAFAAPGEIAMYTASDANISDFFTNVVAPAFSAANEGASVNVVIARDGGTDAVAARALAALQTNTDPQLDFIEQYDPNLPVGGIEAGLWVDLSKAGLPNYGKVNPQAIQSGYGLPWRGSQVLLAYDTTKVPVESAPKTFAALVEWIKANPGQFIYNRPDKGGSGKYFVARAVMEANGLDPSKFSVANYGSSDVAGMLGGGYAILRDLAPSLYDGGNYSGGNAASLQLLAQGAVSMVPIWSDMALQGIATGALPETAGLVQLTDLAFCGGFSQAVVASNGENKELALKLADFLLTVEMQDAILTEVGGFPGVTWDIVSPAMLERFKDVVPASIPTYPDGDWSTALNDGWYREVASGLSRD